MQKNFVVEKYELDDIQMELLNNDNNYIVIAGAGSGKTLTILGKVNYLIERKKISPENILLISFTNASVNDLKKRVKYNVNIYTFHKLAMHILAKNKIDYTICNQYTLKYLIKEYINTCSRLEQKQILKFFKLNITYSNFLKSDYFKKFCELIETLINLYKTNNYNLKEFSKIRCSKKEKNIFLIIFKIYQLYILEKKSSNTFDFDDLIINATYYANRINLNYKYLIIDEFQDCSYIRLNLIKKIFWNNNSKIIVVGDDWQSIYRFSGCDLNLFINFSNYFPKVKTLKLNNTYRNSQELIKIATDFVQKNPNQIKKNLISKKHNLSPIILVPFKNKRFILKKLLNYLLQKTNDLMILTRNNNDIYEYIDNELNIENDFLCFNSKKIKFMTVHKSKGLEAAYTIILNCNNDYLGFPNKIKNYKIIQKLFSNETYPYAEERRLFYVAITRCKESTYILYNQKNPSIFIKELKQIIKSNLGKITYFH